MGKKKLHLICSMVLLLITTSAIQAQYLRQSGKKIIDGDGKEVILRGMGLGGWMLQEGYMLETNSFANPQHEIRAKIVEVIGESNTDEFYEAWYAKHCTKRDIDSLAAWGFNSVRLPMHYNLFTLPIEKEPVAGQQTWLDKGFKMVDDLLEWCEANEMYLILDLHAAPGGQGRDAAISDYDKTKPSLWESPANKQKTVALWRKLAERYATKKWIGGYDLINEPNWAFEGANINGCNEQNNAPLKQLYIDITNAIREVDQNHIIFIEGNCWGNNHAGLHPFPDNNMAISFHKYWNHNTAAAIQDILNLRNQHNAPLWLGESGENSNVWFRSAIELVEDNDIGWAWWPMKKVGSIVNPMTIVKNDGYEQLLNYWKNGGAKPSVATAKAALMQLTENLKIENTVYRKDVIDAMFRQVQSDETKPFKNHKAPGVVHASDFDLGRYMKAYADADTGTYHVSVGSYTAWNNGWSYRNDGVDIQPSNDNDADANGYNVGWTADGEWLQYTVNVDSSAAYQLSIRYAVPNDNSRVKFLVNGSEKVASTTLTSSGSYNTWKNTTINDVILYKGQQKIRLFFEKGGANISLLKFALSKKTNEVSFRAIKATTLDESGTFTIDLTKKVNTASLSAAGFAVKVNGQAAAVTEVKAIQDNTVVRITLDKPLTDIDVITVTYNGTTTSTDGTALQAFTDVSVTNNLPIHLRVPGRVEAENFFVNQGLALETTTDVGGGFNIGYTDKDDYLEYRIRVDEAGTYSVEARVASNATAGKIQIDQMDKQRNVLNSATLDLPVTGGWQTWKTVSVPITLSAGPTLLRIKVIQAGFNLNWVHFKKSVINKTNKKVSQSLLLYPNPVDIMLTLDIDDNIYRRENNLTIRNANGSIVKRMDGLGMDELRKLNVSTLTAGIYFIEYRSTMGSWSNKFVKQ